MSHIFNGIQINLSWIPSNLNNIPPNAIKADDHVYVIRLTRNEETKIGSAMSSLAVVPWNDTLSLLAYGGFEVLSYTGISEFGTNYQWTKCSNGALPTKKNAVLGGITNANDVMYVIKAPLLYDIKDGNQKIIYSAGSLVEGANCASVPVLFSLNSPDKWPCVKVTDYEVLCFKDSKCRF